MSNGGSATFRDDIDFGGKLTQTGTGTNTFAGEVLIDGLANYTGLEVKGSGASRPSIQWSNATQGDLGRIYGTEGNALVLASGSSNATALTLDSSQDATFAGDINLTQTASQASEIKGDRTDSQLTIKGGSAGAGIQLFGSTYTDYAGSIWLLSLIHI